MMHQLTDKKNKIIIYLIFLFILSTVNGKFKEDQSNHSFSMNQINVKGLSSINNSKILKDLNNLYYENILVIGREEVKEVLSRYNVIDEYVVKKVYPSSININIKSTKFIARISNNDQLLVGSNGKLIKDKKNTDRLPYIFGEFNSGYFLDFKKNIEQSKFTFAEFKALYFFPSHRWDILTKEDVTIKLPQDSTFESLNLAYKVLNSNEFKNKILIDLRVNNHLVIK